MVITSAIKKTLLAVSAAVTLFAALPSQANDRYEHPSVDARWHGDDRHDGWRHHGGDHDRDGRWDSRWDGRDGYRHDRYDYDRHHRDDWRHHHDRRFDRDGDRRWR